MHTAFYAPSVRRGGVAPGARDVRIGQIERLLAA